MRREMKVTEHKFDHPFREYDGCDCGYCHDCGAQPFIHDEDQVNAIFDMMESWR